MAGTNMSERSIRIINMFISVGVGAARLIHERRRTEILLKLNLPSAHTRPNPLKYRFA